MSGMKGVATDIEIHAKEMEKTRAIRACQGYSGVRGRAFGLLLFALRYVTPLLIIYIFIRNLGVF